MKRAFSLVLTLLLTLCLCACGEKDTPETTPSTAGTEATAEGTGNTAESTHPTAESTTPSGESTEPSSESTQPTIQETEAATQATTPATQATSCSHSYADATCTAPKTCTKCGATEGQAAGHTYADATCTAPKTCTKCGATEGQPAGHSLTATCTGCGQTNEGFRELVGNFEWSYVEGKAGDEEIVLRFYGFFKEGNQIMVNVANERYATLAALAADREMTVEEIRAEYEELEMIRTYFGTEYGYNGWGVSFDEITFVEDGNTVTLTAVTESWDADDNLQRTEKTSVWTRTGLAEYTVTGGDYIPVGSILTPAS